MAYMCMTLVAARHFTPRQEAEKYRMGASDLNNEGAVPSFGRPDGGRYEGQFVNDRACGAPSRTDGSTCKGSQTVLVSSFVSRKFLECTASWV